MMIKDVMVRLEGGAADDMRLAAVKSVAERFESHVIALYFNILLVSVSGEGDERGAIHGVELLEMARAAGDKTEAALAEKLSRLQLAVDIRRFDIFGDALPDIAAQEAHSADEFVALRPNGEASEPDGMVESVLFGGGRHLLLIPEGTERRCTFENVLLAWNGSRESARAMAEAMPYIHRAKTVSVVIVDEGPPVEEQALLGRAAVTHLRHHGIKARLHHVTGKSREEAGAAIVGEVQRIGADLLVMGGYGHLRLRQFLLGAATREVMHNSPVPLLMAH
jgi:nucleotide-binding universal stress UspA family protein